jgi:hypothetical protein
LTLRIHDPFTLDSGKYSCIISTLEGECSTECDVEIEELNDDANLWDVIPEFVKLPLPAIAVNGPVTFCSRITPIDSDVKWSICGREINANEKGFAVSYIVLLIEKKSYLLCYVATFNI